jgi:hypothetical protein
MNTLSACPAEAIGREHARLWRAFNLAEKRKLLPFECDALVERRRHLEMQATYVQATSLNGAMFQLGLAQTLRECEDSKHAIGRLIASAAKVLISMGGQVVNKWADPTCDFEHRIQAVIADAAEPAQAAAA